MKCVIAVISSSDTPLQMEALADTARQYKLEPSFTAAKAVVRVSNSFKSLNLTETKSSDKNQDMFKREMLRIFSLKYTTGDRLSVNKMFIGGLKEEVDEADLQAYFSRYGNIVNIDIRREHETGRKRGFAFVEFDDYDPVDKVILRRRHIINGKKADVRKALPRERMELQKKQNQIWDAVSYTEKYGISPGEALIAMRLKRGGNIDFG